MVQACVRRWLARLKYRKSQTKAAQSAITLQRHVRGWLTRRSYQALLAREALKRKEEEKLRRQHEEEQQKLLQKLAAERRGKTYELKKKYYDKH